jgi:hypothetical protein
MQSTIPENDGNDRVLETRDVFIWVSNGLDMAPPLRQSASRSQSTNSARQFRRRLGWCHLSLIPLHRLLQRGLQTLAGAYPTPTHYCTGKANGKCMFICKANLEGVRDLQPARVGVRVPGLGIHQPDSSHPALAAYRRLAQLGRAEKSLHVRATKSQKHSSCSVGLTGVAGKLVCMEPLLMADQ